MYNSALRKGHLHTVLLSLIQKLKRAEQPQAAITPVDTVIFQLLETKGRS